MTYVVNRNVNFTNVCYTGCRFCAFAQRRTDADAYTLSLEEVAARAREAWDVGATEICMQGGIDPSLPGSAYADLARAVKTAAPGLHLHAYSPMEVVNGAARSSLSIADFLLSVREAGVDSLPGTAAEILDDDVRWVLTKGKLPTASWIEVVTTAHRLGIPTTSTMMYGHVDQPSTGSATCSCSRGCRTTPAASPSSCRCRSSTPARRSTSPAWPGQGRRRATTARCTPSRACCCTAGSTTCSAPG